MKMAGGESEHPQIQFPMDKDKDISKSDFFCSDCLKSNTELRCEKCEGRFIQESALNHTHPGNSDFKAFDIAFIPHILAFIMADKQFEPIMEMKFNKEQIQNEKVLEKMRTKLYESVKQFEDDVKWFARHCQSIDPVSVDHNNYSCNAAEKLTENVKEQIETINACDTCYRNLFEAFTKGSVEDQCTNRHVLLWAQPQNHPGYWPAKVLAANAEENTVQIQYFGDYSCFWLPLKDNDFYVYSWKCPCEDKSARTKEYSEAQKDAKEYITNIRVKYHNFNYANSLTAFEPGKLNEHWNEMFTEKRSRGAVDESSSSESDSSSDSSSSDSSSSDSSSSDSELSATEDEKISKSMRKRNANRSCRNGPTVKRNRIRNDADETNEADDGNIVNKFENSFREIERITLSATQSIGQLKHELEEINNKNRALEEMNATLTVEKDSLERNIASLKKSQRKEKRKATDGQNALKTKNAELEESQRKQKEALDREKEALAKKNVELIGKHCAEGKMWNDERKTLTEQHFALQSAKDSEKKTLEAQNKALEGEITILSTEKNSLEQKIASLNESHHIEKKKSNDDQNALTKEIADLKESHRKQMDTFGQEKKALERELEDEKKKSADRKKIFEEAVRDWN